MPYSKEHGENTPLLFQATSPVDDSSVGFRNPAIDGTHRNICIRDIAFKNLRGAEISAQYSKVVAAPSSLELADALAPLVAGGIIQTTTGYETEPRPASSVKSRPAFVPFRRRARHRSFTLWWINEFRHWWKSRFVRILYCSFTL